MSVNQPHGVPPAVRGVVLPGGKAGGYRGLKGSYLTGTGLVL